MAKVIMTCGKLCSGKSTYARRMQEELGAVILSMDELMLTLFPEGAGEKHDLYAERTEQYLLSLALKILETGADVILDWGLWTREQRQRLRSFFAGHGVVAEIHYLRISNEEWSRRIRARNSKQPEARPSDYFVDEGLFRKFEIIFQEPSADEADVIVEIPDNSD